MFSTSPSRDLMDNCSPDTPKISQEFLSDLPSSESKYQQQEEEADLNLQVDDLVNGFKNTRIQNIEEFNNGEEDAFHKSRVSFRSEPGSINFKKLLSIDTTNPVQSSKLCNRKMNSTAITEEFYCETSESIMKPKRWGKEEDKLMFSNLKKLAVCFGIDIADLSMTESMTIPLHYKILLALKRKMRWVGTTRQILKRV